jgi:hypothetical protein
MRVTESGHLEYYLEYIDYTEEGNLIFILALFSLVQPFLLHILWLFEERL